LGDAYTPEVAAAYTAMWGIVEATMLSGVKEAEGTKASSFGEPEIKLIKDSWATVETLPAETVGGLLFKHIFEQADVSALFSFGRKPGFNADPAAVADNPDVKAHGAKVVGTVAVAISMLTTLDKLVPVLKDLGAKHAKYGVEAAHYPVVGGAFLKTLSVGLGDAYTPEVAAAYTAMWGIVEATMLSGVKEAEGTWGHYAVPATREMEALTVASQEASMDWYTNPVATDRGHVQFAS